MALVAGLALGGILVAGWSGWDFYTTRQAQQASAHYERLRLAVQGSDSKQAEKVAAHLTSDYARTPYASLASLVLAADQVKRQQFESAVKQYQWVIEHASDRKLQHVARLRLGRLLWSLGRSDEALQALSPRRPGTFEPLFLELRGDILAGQGRHEEAKRAYSSAIESDISPELREGVELKLNDLNTLGASAKPPAPSAEKDS